MNRKEEYISQNNKNMFKWLYYGNPTIIHNNIKTIKLLKNRNSSNYHTLYIIKEILP